MKNRLYRKYKILCIFITPGELRDLKRSLVGEVGKEKVGRFKGKRIWPARYE